MAAQLKADGRYPLSVFAVRRPDFDRLVRNCENAPKATDELKQRMAAGKALIKTSA
ncbi:hypothetical protein [uncultured Brevundimonas sp.]|jgi:hypothetical protein|uniref:hypothetical protein n=1 Tax=uncultured Brevundimonas sp. TaxID=213418 RepID=UPI0025DED0CF|nr:hypothetical protein [uncultured Brevundimonas sp.]